MGKNVQNKRWWFLQFVSHLMKVGCKQTINQRLYNCTVPTAQPTVTISKEYLSNTPVVGTRLVCAVTQGHITIRIHFSRSGKRMFSAFPFVK